MRTIGMQDGGGPCGLVPDEGRVDKGAGAGDAGRSFHSPVSDQRRPLLVSWYVSLASLLVVFAL